MSIQITNDRKITIAQGASRYSLNWQNVTLNYSELVDKLKTPLRSSETISEYLKMPKAKQDAIKDVGGFVGGALKSKSRKSCNVEYRDVITLDLDNIPAGGTQEVIKKVITLGCNYCIYSTKKHTEYRPRLRVVLPTNRSMTVDEYEPVARKVAEMIGIEMADPSTFEASRLMYWANCSSDGEYIYKYEDKPFLSADGVLAMYTDWHDVSTWARVPGENAKHKKMLVKQQDPTTKTGIVGAFCRAYDVYNAISTFIPDAYEECAREDRFTYTCGTTTGGAVVYDNGKFLYSHHATDPCSGLLVNAWDLVRLHKFSHLDNDTKQDTPVVSLPSFLAMKALAKADKTVNKLIAEERRENAKQYFEDLGNISNTENKTEEDNAEWLKLITTDINGKIQNTIANVVLILDNDTDYKDKIYLDEFANRGMVQLPLPWDNGEGARIWSDFDDANLSLRLEKAYGITSKIKTDLALKVVGYKNKRNAVKEWILAQEWDGVKRIPTLLHDYLGAEQSIYTESIMRKSLVAAVARVFDEKGVKFDYMTILAGKQGLGKSTFLSKLGREWFSDSLYSFEGKEAAELIQGTLINEIGELSAMNRSEMETIKQFLSKTHDIYREAYGKRTAKYPRRCVFFGSTNKDEFLKDTTGNRRFWVCRVGENTPQKSVFKDLDNEIPQIWAEAYCYYLLGEELFLSDEALAVSEQMQDEFKETDERSGIILEFLDMKIPTDWYSMTVADQRAFRNGNFKIIDDTALQVRDKVCASEIWQICFNGDLKYMRKRESIEINNIMSSLNDWEKNKSLRRYGSYGIQRGFERK